MIHANSMSAYQDLNSTQTAYNRQKAIISCIRWFGPLTVSQIKEKLNFTERNQVAPRVTELLDMGILEELSSIKDPYSGRSVMVVGLES